MFYSNPQSQAFYVKITISLPEALKSLTIISTHETMSGYVDSSSSLMTSITSNPPREFVLGVVVFSHTKVNVSSNNTEATQPSTYYRCSRVSKRSSDK